MNRSELIDRLSQHLAEVSAADAEAAVAVILGAMADALAHGHRIEIRGFGSFSVRQRGARTARNPRTGESFDVPPKLYPHFKPGKSLREHVDGNRSHLVAE